MNDDKQIRVSYLITTRNRAQYLQRTLDNVREFITPEDELIIFDAASTDDTQHVAERNTDIIALFVSEPDKGEAHGFNKGILASRGKYIKFLTDDDYFYPDVMRRSIEMLEKNPDVDVILSRGVSWSVSEEGAKSNPIERRLAPPHDFRANLISHGGIKLSGQSLLLRRDAVSQLGLLDCRKQMVDIDYFVKLIESKLNCRYDDNVLYDHFIWSGSGCSNLKSNDNYWNELAEALFRLGDWKSLRKLPPKSILSVLKFPNYFHGQQIVLLLVLLVRRGARLVSLLQRFITRTQ